LIDRMRHQLITKDTMDDKTTKLIQDGFKQVNARFDEMDGRFEGLEERVEKRIDDFETRTDKRLSLMEMQLKDFRVSVNARFDEMNARFDTVMEKINDVESRLESDARATVKKHEEYEKKFATVEKLLEQRV